MHAYRSHASRTALPKGGPGLKDFLKSGVEAHRGHINSGEIENIPYVTAEDVSGQNRRVYFETYGCQMNASDTEVAWSILKDAGYSRTGDVEQADVVLAVTCAIRENAEKKVWSRLDYFRGLKKRRGKHSPPLKVGILGCMAERLKEKLIEKEKIVDLVAGPDAYRDLPRMLSITQSGQSAVNVLLSLDETYADVVPVRVNPNSPSAYVSVMRGCDNMCSFCIVPFTRGRERSRPIDSILAEVQQLSDQGVRDVTLLGQNVNSYRDMAPSSTSHQSLGHTHLSEGFSTIYRTKEGGRRFAELLDRVACVDPEMRVRFTSPHPKDFPDELLQVIQERHNICKHVHLPVQSGSSRMLLRMRRGHTREAYFQLVHKIRRTVPGVTLSSDFIAGFCGETEDDHQLTLSLLEEVRYNMAYLFAYSMRKKTHAFHRMEDNVPHEVKQRRLVELVNTFYSLAKSTHQNLIGSHQLVLVEKTSKKSKADLIGRTDGNLKLIFPRQPVPCALSSATEVTPAPGDYVHVVVTGAGSLSLRGTPIKRTSLQVFHAEHSRADNYNSSD